MSVKVALRLVNLVLRIIRSVILGWVNVHVCEEPVTQANEAESFSICLVQYNATGAESSREIVQIFCGSFVLSDNLCLY